MPILTVEPDLLRATYGELNQKAQQLLDEELKLRQAASSLDMAWQGNSAAEFMTELERLQQQLRVLVQDLFTLAQRINREADRWEESDQSWVHEYREIFIKKPIFGG